MRSSAILMDGTVGEDMATSRSSGTPPFFNGFVEMSMGTGDTDPSAGRGTSAAGWGGKTVLCVSGVADVESDNGRSATEGDRLSEGVSS